MVLLITKIYSADPEYLMEYAVVKKSSNNGLKKSIVNFKKSFPTTKLIEAHNEILDKFNMKTSTTIDNKNSNIETDVTENFNVLEDLLNQDFNAFSAIHFNVKKNIKKEELNESDINSTEKNKIINNQSNNCYLISAKYYQHNQNNKTQQFTSSTKISSYKK